MAGNRPLVVSVLAHGAALAAIAYWLYVDADADDDDEAAASKKDDRDRDPVAQRHDDTDAITIEILPSLPASAPEAEVLDGDGPEATVAVEATVIASRTGRHRRAGVSRPSTGTEPGTRSDGEPGRANPLRMRGLRHDLKLSGEAVARILEDRPLPEPVKPTGLIQPNGREGRIEDTVARFVVYADGSIDLTNKKDIDPRWMIPLPTPSRILRGARDLGNDLAAWRDNPYRDRDVGTMQDLPRHLQATPGSCQTFADPMCGANPTARVTRGLGGDAFIIPILGGGLDITSALHRTFVGDPYSSRKLEILDRTRAERVERGAVHRAAQLDRSAELMSHNLEALWRATTNPAARREALFELWDECAEGDGPTGTAGARARAMVIGWIGTHLPQGQPGAFTADDIARLDAKRSSKQHFAPYGDRSPSSEINPRQRDPAHRDRGGP